jgi:hypothetical protein
MVITDGSIDDTTVCIDGTTVVRFDVTIIIVTATATITKSKTKPGVGRPSGGIDAGACDCSRSHNQIARGAGVVLQKQRRGPDTRGEVYRSGARAIPFCQGDPGLIGRSRIPIAASRPVKTCP